METFMDKIKQIILTLIRIHDICNSDEMLPR